MVVRSSTIGFYFHSFIHCIATRIFTLPMMIQAIQTPTARMHGSIQSNLQFGDVFMVHHNGKLSSLQAYHYQVFRYLRWWSWSIVTVSMRGGVSISAPVRQAQLEQSCNQQAFQEPYNGNRQQLHFIPHMIQKFERNVLRDGHRLLQIWQSVLESFGRSKQPSQRWSHTFL